MVNSDRMELMLKAGCLCFAFAADASYSHLNLYSKTDTCQHMLVAYHLSHHLLLTSTFLDLLCQAQVRGEKGQLCKAQAFPFVWE